MQKLVEAEVEGIFTLIAFGDAKVPVGFLGAFRKKNHLPCEPGGGFVTEVMSEGKKRNRLCPCATERAIKRYRLVGAKGFETMAADWTVKFKEFAVKRLAEPVVAEKAK